MKKLHAPRITLAFFILLLALINNASAQVPTPQITNISACIQLRAPGNGGNILIAPNLINKLNTISWAGVLPGDTDRTHVHWQSETCSPAGDSSAIIALINEGGAGNEGKFYILYQDSTLALDTVSAGGPGIPVALDHNIFDYYQLAGQNTLYLVTTSGFIYESTNGGQTWQADTVNASANGFIAVALDTFQNVYALYSPGGTTQVCKQDAHATSWRPLTGFPNGQIVTGLFTDRRGYIFVSTYLTGVFCSTDTGNTFKQSTTVFSAGTGQQFCDDVFGNIYMVCNGNNQLYRSSDTGSTWVSIASPIIALNRDSGNYSSGNGYVINSISGDSVLTVSTIYGMFVSHDQGNTWEAINQGLHQTQFNGFYKSPAGRYVETTNNGIFYIDPGNSNFTISFPDSGYEYAGPVYADSLGYLHWRELAPYAGDFVSVFWRSEDDGTTWLADTASNIVGIATAGFGVDEYGNLHFGAYENGVNIFNKSPGGNFVIDSAGIGFSLGNYYNINAIVSDDNGNLYMGGGGNATPLTCWRRPVNGGTWVLDTAGLPFRTPVTYLTSDTLHNMIAVAGQLYYRQFGLWTALNLPAAAAPGTGNIAAAVADNTGGILIAISPVFNYGGYGVYCTHDFGNTWNYVGLNGINVYALYGSGDTTYALSDLGIFALTCNGVVQSITQPLANINTSNLNLYPNPAEGDCNAVFTLPSSSHLNELDIVDVCGATLKSISIAPGAAALNFNTGDISHGIYLCVLKSDGVILDVKKLAVVK